MAKTQPRFIRQKVARGKGKTHYDFSEPVGDKNNDNESFDHPIIAMRRAAEDN